MACPFHSGWAHQPQCHAKVPGRSPLRPLSRVLWTESEAFRATEGNNRDCIKRKKALTSSVAPFRSKHVQLKRIACKKSQPRAISDSEILSEWHQSLGTRGIPPQARLAGKLSPGLRGARGLLPWIWLACIYARPLIMVVYAFYIFDRHGTHPISSSTSPH